MFLEQAKHIVRSFTNDKQPIVTASDGINALRIADAVLKAGGNGRTINL